MNSRDPGFCPISRTVALSTPAINPLQHGLAVFHGSPPDYARAVGWFRAAAESGDRDGIAMLGLCQLEGLGIPADPVQARVLLVRAAGLGSAMGHYQLGRVLITGRGGPMDEEGGVTAYVAAAALGHAEATFNLASCLHAGVGCLPDRLAAKALYLRSRNLGCTLRPKGVMVQKRELKAVRALAMHFSDPTRLTSLVRERQQALSLAQAMSQPEGHRRSADEADPKHLRQAGRLAAGVMAAMAGTLGQYLRPTSRDAGPTKIDNF